MPTGHARPDRETVRPPAARAILSATIGQSLYLQPPRVTLPGRGAAERQYLDLIGEINLTAYRNWNLHAGRGLQPDRLAHRAGRGRAAVPRHGQQVANINYQYRDGQLRADRCLDRLAGDAATGTCTRAAIGVHSLASMRRPSTARSRTSPAFSTAAPAGACDAVWQRSVSHAQRRARQRRILQVELTGLSNVGSQVTLSFSSRFEDTPRSAPATPLLSSSP